MRVLVSGGGTAGHISPILATSDALKQLDKDIELLYVGQAGSMEARIATAAGLRFEAIKAGKFRRYHNANAVSKVFNISTLGLNARDAGRFLAGVSASIKIIRRFKPDVVFIKGGYVGLPVGLAARLLRVPTVIHESDVSPGLTNRTLARWASSIAVGFPGKSYTQFDGSKLIYTGNPVRAELLQAHRLAGLAKFKLDQAMPVILVTGGSQGAQPLNDVLLDALPQLLERYQVLHLTGEREFPRLQFELKRLGDLPHAERYHPYAFLMDDMGLALAAADLVIARAGAQTIAELAALGKPTVLIPNILMAGHQEQNARVLARQGAVRVLDERKLTPSGLVGEIDRILGSDTEQELLGKGIAQFAKPDASMALARVILAAAGGRGAA
jgi:UDP-N-acetylglucosamine--N-acetylmuramyl-(pentapeptide) pyrophosphoryl-undecaprenol N-acetylglucosamine transferase